MSSPALLAARERVVRLLTDRYADDTLTVEAFEAELDRLNALTDPADLERMAESLTTGVRTPVPRAAPAPTFGQPTYGPPAYGPRAAVTPDARGNSIPALGWQRGALVPALPPADGRVLAVMSATHRAGPWAVPRVLRVVAVMSEVLVDLRDAVIPAEGCEVEVSALMANVRVLLPPGVEAHVELMAFLGAAKDDTRAAVGGPTGPTVRVHGSAVMAEVTVFGA